MEVVKWSIFKNGYLEYNRWTSIRTIFKKPLNRKTLKQSIIVRPLFETDICGISELQHSIGNELSERGETKKKK